jgi:hypothetical protein
VIGKHSQLEVNPSPHREQVEVLKVMCHVILTTNAKDEYCSRVEHDVQTIKWSRRQTKEGVVAVVETRKKEGMDEAPSS